MPDDAGYPSSGGVAATVGAAMPATASYDSACDAEQRRIVSWCAEVADLPRYLPSFLVERQEREGAVRRDRVLRVLSCEDGMPSGSELSFGLRCLKSYGELRYPQDAEFRVSVCLLLWRLFAATVELSPPVYSYALRTRVVDALKLWLLRFAEESLTPVGYDEALPADVNVGFEQLRSVLDIRLPLRLIAQEMGGSFRVDRGVSCGKRRNFVHGLVNLCVATQRFLAVSVGPWLSEHLGCRLDGTHCYVMLYARMLVVLMPLACVPRLILDGRLWSWWACIPEGTVPKFDLMWFGMLGRYAELRWAGGVPAALQDTGSSHTPATEADCERVLTSRLPWLVNKVCRTMSLPFCSPAASAMEGKASSAIDLDRYAIPDELDSVVMGQQSSWKDVAKFLIYSLEAEPPPLTATKANDGPLADAGSTWSLLLLLVRRMRPFLKPANANGDWLWHCSTFNHGLVVAYFRRICRERLTPCTASQSRRLTRTADERFVELMLPVMSDTAQVKSAYEQVTAFDSLMRLSRISVMYHPASSWSSLCAGSVDPFADSMPALIFRAAESLGDPAQSDRHVTLLSLCACTLHSLALRWPSALNALLPSVLWGIDPTDVQKTLASFGLLVTMLCDVPCVDSNDWPSGAAARADPSPAVAAHAGAWNWPWPPGTCFQEEPGEDSGACIAASMMPAFAADFVERICDYVVRIPKPAKGNGLVSSATAHFEYASLSLMGGALCLLASQCDPDTYKGMVNSVSTFVNTSLLLDQIKPMKIMVVSVARVDPGMALPVLLPPLLKKLLSRKHAPGGAAVPLHDMGNSESEAKWCLNALSAVVRYAGAALLPYRGELEAVVTASLMDEREGIPKLGAKLLRRLLFSTSAIYMSNGYRLVGGSEWQRIMSARGATGFSGDAWPLKWWGQKPPWWANHCFNKGGSDSLSRSLQVEWHMPAREELEWAQALVSGALQCISHSLVAAGIKAAGATGAGPPPAAEVEGTQWLSGFKLPAKKRTSHGAVLAMKLTYAVIRGTEEWWPDERSNEELEEVSLPPSPPHAVPSGVFGRRVFDWLANLLQLALLELSEEDTPRQSSDGIAASSVAPASAAGGAAPLASMALDSIEVPKILGKVIACVGELTGALREGHPEGATLFQSSVRKRGADIVGSSSLMQRSTVLDGIHMHSKWRDLPRVWWMLRIADTFEAHRAERNGCHRFTGRRRQILETLCRLSFAGSFEIVRSRAQEVLSCAAKLHTGCRWPLIRDVALPALAAETEATLRCNSLTGEAADREHTRLNDALVGLASLFGGGLPGFVSTVWRRGVDDASRVGLALCEAIYAATKLAGPAGAACGGAGSSTPFAADAEQPMSQTLAGARPAGDGLGAGTGEQRCEVEADTMAALAAAGKYWLEHREVLCRDPPRRRGMKTGGCPCGDEEDDEESGGDEETEDDPEAAVAAAGAGGSHGMPKGVEALKAVERLLDICERPDCHWRAQVMATAASLGIRNAFGILHADAVLSELGRPVWRRWAMWLVHCCEPRKPLGLHSLATHGLCLLLRRPAPLTDADLAASPPHGPGLCDDGFLEKMLAILPAIHHPVLASGGTKGEQLEITRDAVVHITEQRLFRLWPRVWLKRSSRHFSLKGALLWQTYVAFLLRAPKASASDAGDAGVNAEHVPALAEERLVHLFRRGANYFTSQPVGEAEYHVAFVGFCAGALRAVRRDRHAALRRRAWELLHEPMTSEVQKASQERLDEWCDGIRFAAMGTSRPLLRGGGGLAAKSDGKSEEDEESGAHLVPLLNFVAGLAGEEPDQDVLSFGLPEVKFEEAKAKAAASAATDGEGDSPAHFTKDESSMPIFRRLRLMMSLLKEPRAVSYIRSHPNFTAQAWAALRPGIEHPYKQLREEVARAVFLLLRASRLPHWPPWQRVHCAGSAGSLEAADGSGISEAVGLPQVAHSVEGFLGAEAERLQGLLRDDNASQKGSFSDKDRPAHVCASSGLCYTVFYVALSRRTAFHLAAVLPQVLAFLLAASAHSDHELRALGPQALAVVCSAHPLPPVSSISSSPVGEPQSIAAAALLSLLGGSSTTLPDKEYEKALGAVRSVVAANFMLLSCARNGNTNSGKDLAALRALAEASAGHSKHEVRTAAKGALTSFFGLDTRADVLANLGRYRISAGPAPTSRRGSAHGGEGVKSKLSGGDVPATALAGVVGICCALLAAADCGVPSWTGRVVEVLAPYGRQGVADVALKEVQGAIQTFLKLQQSSRRAWKECQDRLSPAQLDLLTASKGKLSYFS